MAATFVSRCCFIGGHDMCEGTLGNGDPQDVRTCGCQCHATPVSDKVELILTEREVRKLENIAKTRARYQDRREGSLHKAEANFLYDLIEKLERARRHV